MSSSAVKKINEEIESLPEHEQLTLVNMIIERLISRKENKNLDIRDLKNMGKGIWSKENIKGYINKERDQWENL
ncbi:MAG: hypothetical protein AAB116_18755 [Candidatus Poribacteria bacterium]